MFVLFKYLYFSMSTKVPDAFSYIKNINGYIQAEESADRVPITDKILSNQSLYLNFNEFEV